jgi:hypothetical protein
VFFIEEKSGCIMFKLSISVIEPAHLSLRQRRKNNSKQQQKVEIKY